MKSILTVAFLLFSTQSFAKEITNNITQLNWPKSTNGKYDFEQLENEIRGLGCTGDFTLDTSKTPNEVVFISKNCKLINSGDCSKSFETKVLAKAGLEANNFKACLVKSKLNPNYRKAIEENVEANRSARPTK